MNEGHAPLKWGLKLLVLISMGQFLFQQLALFAGISNTRPVTVIPYAIAAAIYGGMAIRYRYAPRLSISIRSLPFGSLQDYLLVGLLTLSVLQIFNPGIPLSAGVMGFLMGPYWIGFFFVGRQVLKGDKKLGLLLLRLIVIVIAFSAAYGVVGLVVEYPWNQAYLASSPEISIFTVRMGSSIGYPAVSGLAGMLGFLTGLSLSLAQSERRWMIIMATCLALLLTIASGSRSAMLGAVAGLAMTILLKRSVRSFPILVIVTIFVISVLFGIKSKTTTYAIESLATISPQQLFSGAVLQERNLAVRIEHWPTVIPIIWQHPLGQGVGSWHQAMTFDRVQVGMVADNEYLALTGELGFLGLFLYLAFVGTLWWQCWRVLRSRKARGKEMAGMWAIITSSTLIGVLIMSFASHPLYSFPSTMLVWLLWGMGSRFMEEGHVKKNVDLSRHVPSLKIVGPYASNDCR